MSIFEFRNRTLPTDETHIMGVLNVTPDSFSDGGQYHRRDAAIRQAAQMVSDGAAIVDVGGESTRPGALPVTVAEEMDRVLPVVERLVSNVDAVVSVDTSSPEVMREAASLGAHLINDVRALQREGALEAAAQSGLPIVLMHMQGQPETMQERPEYTDVIADVRDFLQSRIQASLNAGILRERLILDPGFGFGKTVNHNLRLANQLQAVAVDDLPLLVGMSRKSTIGAVLNRSVDDRLSGTMAFTAAAVWQGAFIVRVHDVAENVDVVRMISAIRNERL